MFDDDGAAEPEHTIEPSPLDETDKWDDGLTILKLTPAQCRYGVGANRYSVTVFCGEPVTKAGSSWCAHHHKRTLVSLWR
jgi:hypothetical protein